MPKKAKDPVKPCPLKNKGSIVVSVTRTDASKKKQKVGKALKGVTITVSTVGKPETTGGSGAAQFKKLADGTYTVTATLSPTLAREFEIETNSDQVTIAAGSAEQVDFTADRHAALTVTVKGGPTALGNVRVNLTGTKVANRTTAGTGIADFGTMPTGNYSVALAFTTNDANDQKWLIPAAQQITVVRGVALAHEIVLVEKPAFAVKVMSRDPDVDLVGVDVTVSDGSITQTVRTLDTGVATFAHVSLVQHTIDLALAGENAKNYLVPAQATFTPVATAPNALTINVAPKPCPVFIKLLLATPEGGEHALPADLPLRLRLDNDQTIDCKLDAQSVLVDANGAELKAPRPRKFTLELPVQANKYVVCEKAGDPPTQELVTDAAPDFATPLGLAMALGKRALLLPQVDCKLIEFTVEVTPVTHFATPNFAFLTEETIGTTGAPVKLLLKPQWQFVRLEYFDRHFGFQHHAKKRISIPPVLLRGVRKSLDGTLATPEAASNWTVKDAENDKACQALPWLLTRKATDGAVLPKLDKEMLLSFGQDKAWVVATSETARKIEKLDPTALTDQPKLAPGKDRGKYYDLPKLWKSCFYYTRLPGNTGKPFDELSETEIEGSYTITTPLTFSLDDLVLTTNGGDQAVRDQGKTGTAKDRGEHSRVAVLHLDPDDKYKVKVFDPRADAAFHSKSQFIKDAADKWRNVLIDYPPNPRVVVFCNGFHDVFDQRTENGDFGQKQITGARAARLGDDRLSVTKRFNQQTDVDSAYVHLTRRFDAYFLHYGAADGTTVYSAVVSHWTARFFARYADRPGPDAWSNGTYPVSESLADARNYRDAGMRNAMVRWNTKDYQYEEKDDKTDIVIKSFYLFEAKDVEAPANSGTFHEYGGVHHCAAACSGVDINGKEIGSWANETQMYMRRSAYKDEGVARGSNPNTEARALDYDGTTATARCALAHELGHAAVGLFDDYITQTDDASLPTYAKDNLDPSVSGLPGGTVKSQRYPGVAFYRDKSSLMSNNQAVRLRMFWGRANWINDEAKDTKTLHKFLATKQFRVAYDPGGGKTKLKYFLDDASRCFYRPTHTEKNVALGEQGKADLHLYKLGPDEFSSLLKEGPFDGMLVVETRICTRFRTGLTPGAAPWATATEYDKGACVDEEGKFYTCITKHTSAANFATDTAHWKEMDPDVDPANWAYNANLTAGKWRKSGTDWYVCAADHKTGSRADHHWTEAGAPAPWAANGAYAIGDRVTEAGTEYICKSAQAGSATFAGVQALNWRTTAGLPAWVKDTNYALNALVKEGGKFWFCKVAHQSGKLAADVEAGRMVKALGKPDKWPDAQAKEDWYVDLNKAIVAQLEGAEGKFKLKCTTPDKAFTNTYVRAFPQWMDKPVADPDPANTQFSIVITRGGLKNFGATAGTLRVGSACDNKTIIRYLYGKLSDSATTRAGQNLTDDLTVNDLAKLKEWIEAKTTNTFAADSIGPSITDVTPATGAVVGATVTITGTKLTGATAVKFGAGAAAVPTVVSATQATVVVPPSATSGVVELTTPQGKALSPRRYPILPAITALAPTTPVAVGTEITITGTTLTGTTQVKVNATEQKTVTNVSATQVKAKVPVGASTGKVAITTPDGTALSTTDLTVIPPPTVGVIAPTSAKVGDTVTINGTELTGATLVKFNATSQATLTVDSATKVTAKVPVGATTGKIEVTTPGGVATSATDLTVIPPPTITGIAPASAKVGDTVTIDGTELTGATLVKFNGTNQATLTVDSATKITVKVPVGATTGTLEVTTPGGVVTSAATLTVTPPPTVTGIAPASAKVGDTVTITGTELTGATLVKFNGIAQATLTVASATTITLQVPVGATSGAIEVTTPGGVVTSVATFTVTL